MAVIFQVRGTALNAYLATASATSVNLVGAAVSAPAIVTTSLPSNTFGSSLIDLSHATLKRALAYEGRSNWSPASPLTVLMRFTPLWTGSPAVAQGLLSIGPADGSLQHGMSISINTSGKFIILVRDQNASNSVNWTTTAAWSPTSGTMYDIMLSWDGTTGSNAVKLSVDGSSFETFTAASARSSVNNLGATGIIIGASNSSSVSNIYLNEFVIYNTAETYTYSVRSDFITATANDGGSYSDPGIANVKTGTSYVQAGISLTGTYTGSDRWTDPGASNVLSGIAYKANSTSNNQTGTLAVPTAAQVASAVWNEALSGHTTAGTAGATISQANNNAKQAKNLILAKN